MILTRTTKVSLVILFAAGLVRGQESADIISNRDIGRRALKITLSYMKDRDPDIRGMAASILGQAGNRSAVGVLKKMLSDPDKHVRIRAAEALWELGDPSGLKIIYAIIGDVPVRNQADNSPLAELRIISQNKVREHAIAAFSRMKKNKAANVLLKLKNDAFGAIRDTAARELARLGYTEELAQFLDATSDAALCSGGAGEPDSTSLERGIRREARTK